MTEARTNYWDPDDSSTPSSGGALIHHALGLHLTSLVLPSLGGRGGVSPTRRARAICAVLKEFGQLPRSAEHSVQHLLFADVAREPLAAIEDELNRRLYLP